MARGLAAEFLALGVTAGLLAAVGASGIGFLLARHVFDIETSYTPNTSHDTGLSASIELLERSQMKEKSSPATIFISYSHTARQHMLVFRKHLEGLLFGRARIWSDQAIPRGEKWESKLLSHLKLADAALEYLHHEM